MTATSREEWLALRRQGIGGSDVAAILGLSKFKTQQELWMDKTGRLAQEAHSPDAEERMHWGNALEDVVAKHYAQQSGQKVQRINQILHHPECPIAMANLDRVVLEEGKRGRWDPAAGRVLGAQKVLEVKTAHAMAMRGDGWGEPGTDEVPESYWLQCMWYMGITKLPTADLAVLFGGQKFVTYTIAYQPDVFEPLLEKVDQWWRKYVVADTPPPPQNEADALWRWPSSSSGKSIIVDYQVSDAVERLAQIRREMKVLDYQEKEVKDLICAAFEDAEAITYMGQKIATWKSNKPTLSVDNKAVLAELAEQFGADAVQAVIEKHTKPKAGARVLRLCAN